MKITLVIRNFLTYSFGSLLLRGISFISAPITLYYVSPSEFGLLALLTSFGSICTILFGLGLRQLLTIEFFHLKKEKRINFITDLIIFYCFIGIPILGLLLSHLPFYKNLFFPSNTNSWYLAIVLCNCFLFFFVELYYQLLRFQEKAITLIAIQLISTAICFGITILGLIYYQLGIGSMLLGQLLSLCFTTTVGFMSFLYKRMYTFIKPKRALFRTWLYLPKSIVFMPGLLFSWIISGADRWLLAYFMDLHTVGIYALANTFAQLFYFLVLMPMGNAYIPYMLKQFTAKKNLVASIEKQNRKHMVWAMAFCFFLISLGSVFLILLKPLLPLTYHKALIYIFPLLLAQLWVMGVYFANCLLQFNKCTYFLAFSILIPATINCTLNWLFIPVFGLAGCVGATMLANGIYFVITLLYNRIILNNIILQKKSSPLLQGATIKGSYLINQSNENPPLTQIPHSDKAHGRHLTLQQEEFTEQLDSQD